MQMDSALALASALAAGIALGALVVAPSMTSPGLARPSAAGAWGWGKLGNVWTENGAAKEGGRDGQQRNERESERGEAQEEQGGEDGTRVRAIGRMRSVFASRNYTPNQPTRCPASRGRIELANAPSGCLDELEDFSHVWVLFVFHDNDGQMSKGKVLPPRKPDKKKVGIYCCRTPTRPNPIGLSLVKVDKVDRKKMVVHVSGVDLLDGTPVLDIKPYIPDHDKPIGQVSVSDWVGASSNLKPDFDTVLVEKKVREKLARMDLSRTLYDTPEEIVELLMQILLWDGRKRHVREEHNASGHGQWIFEMSPKLDFILTYPGPGVVCCTDVLPKGVFGIRKGKGLVRIRS